MQPNTKTLGIARASVRLRSTDEGIPQLSLLDRRHRTVRRSLRRSQIKTGQLQFVQSRHDLGPQEFDANPIHHFLQRIIPLFNAIRGEASILKQGYVTSQSLSIWDAKGLGESGIGNRFATLLKDWAPEVTDSSAFGKAQHKTLQQRSPLPSPSPGSDPKNVSNVAASGPLAVYNCSHIVALHLHDSSIQKTLQRSPASTTNFLGGTLPAQEHDGQNKHQNRSYNPILHE